MPRLIRGVARTAVVAGTATAVSGRVQRRQAERYADRDAQIYADREAAYQQQVAPPAPPPPAAAPLSEETLALLEKLAALHDSGVLTDTEFQLQKTALLGG
jgi:hypothetical protein